MKNCLVIYYSYTANNEKLAKELARRLSCELLKIEETRTRSGFKILLDVFFNRKPTIRSVQENVARYKHVIFVAPVWGGKIASPIRSFIDLYRDQLKHYSFVSICGGRAGQPEDIRSELTKLVGVAPEQVEELAISELIRDSTHPRQSITDFRIKADGFGPFEKQLQKVCQVIVRH